jgi:hypothetical protein
MDAQTAKAMLRNRDLVQYVWDTFGISFDIFNRESYNLTDPLSKQDLKIKNVPAAPWTGICLSATLINKDRSLTQNIDDTLYYEERDPDEDLGDEYDDEEPPLSIPDNTVIVFLLPMLPGKKPWEDAYDLHQITTLTEQLKQPEFWQPIQVQLEGAYVVRHQLYQTLMKKDAEYIQQALARQAQGKVTVTLTVTLLVEDDTVATELKAIPPAALGKSMLALGYVRSLWDKYHNQLGLTESEAVAKIMAETEPAFYQGYENLREMRGLH